MQHSSRRHAPATTSRLVDELASKEAIRDVLYRYCRGVDRCDAELLRSVYHDDATDVHGNVFCGSGHDFADFIVEQLRGSVFGHHSITNVMIEVDGDHAFVESQYDSTNRSTSADGRVVDRRSLGRYLDVFERREGEWRIQHRRVVVESISVHPPVGDVPLDGDDAPRALPHELRSRTDRSDPVYRGFAIAEVLPPQYRADITSSSDQPG